MGSVPTLLAVLLLLHLSEHVVWVRPGAWFFRRRGRGWEVASPRAALISSVRGHLHWVYPAPGLGRAFVVTEPGPVGAIPVHGARPVGPPTGDPADLMEVRLRQETADRASRPLRWTTFVLLGMVWLLAPALLGFLGASPMLWIVVPLLLIAMAVHAAMLFRLHRRLFPELADERLRLVLSACLSPIAALRSMDLAQKWALDGTDPLVIAAALPGFRGWEALAADRWRRLKYADPTTPPSAELVPMAGPTTTGTSTGFIEALARQLGLDPAAWDAPPEAADPANTHYCPQCRSQFTGQATRCHDCQWPSLSRLR